MNSKLLFLKKYSFGIIIPSIEAEGFCVLAKEGKLLDKFVIHTNQGGLSEALHKYDSILLLLKLMIKKPYLTVFMEHQIIKSIKNKRNYLLII